MDSDLGTVISIRKMKTEDKPNRLLWTTEILSFLEQSNISAKNLRRLQVLEAETLDDVAKLASAVRQIAIVCPGKRKRWKRLKHQHGELFKLALEVGLLEYWEDADATDYPGELLGEEDVFGIWIEPRHDEVEPALEEIRLATDDAAPCWW